MRRVVRLFCVFLVVALVLPVGAASTVIAALVLLPLPASLPPANPEVKARVSHIVDAQGRELASYRTFEQRVPVKPSDIPDVLKQAVIASEDRRFYSHGGVDVQGSLRALWADIRGKQYVQGGSTITQQYVKEAYLSRERTLSRKLREAMIARYIDREVPKDEILYRYLSIIYFGDGAYGVGAASESYFRKGVDELTLSEAALLAGIIPAPSDYEPRHNPASAEARRKAVLREMYRQKRITKAQFDEAIEQRIYVCCPFGPPAVPVTLVWRRQDPPTEFPYFVDYVRRYIIARHGEDALYKGGLQVQTTLDPRIQLLAQQAVSNMLAGTEPPLEEALVAVEPPTGYVKALVGGRDFNAQSGQVNLALGRCPPQPRGTTVSAGSVVCLDGGGTGRQPGSSFKAFTLAKAFEKGISPEKVYRAPTSYRLPGCTSSSPQSGCVIRNAESEGGGSQTLRQATWHSINTVFAQVIQDAGVNDTAELAHRLGITAVTPGGHYAGGYPYDPHLTLGVVDVAPLDMAGAYSVFANHGLRQAPTPIVKIVDVNGKVLEDNTAREPKRVLDQAVADTVTDLLRGVLTSGTARTANIGRPAAGKTGTTDENKDAWFVGYTPTLSTAVWMGYSDNPRPLRGIKGVSRVYGGTLPARTWRDFMSRALDGVPETEFDKPAPIEPIADALRRFARFGIDPGDRQEPSPGPTGGPYLIGPPKLEPVAPAAPPTTVADSSPPSEAAFSGGRREKRGRR
jgi:penicillin-binding protein 1A